MQCGQRFQKELDMKKHVLRRHSKTAGAPQREVKENGHVLPIKLTQKNPISPPLVLSSTQCADENGMQQTSDFECSICIEKFKTMKDLEGHKETMNHQNNALRLLHDEELVLMEKSDGGYSPLMQEILTIHKQCKTLEKEIEKLVSVQSESQAKSEMPMSVESGTFDSMCMSHHIPQGYPFKFTYKVPTVPESVTPINKQLPETTNNENTTKSQRFYAFVNEAQLIGTVNMELMCAFRTSDPSSKFSVLVRRPVLASRIQKEVQNVNEAGRLIEEETFVVECRGKKWCDFAKGSIRPGVVVAINGRLSMRPQFHESDGSYTYNAVVEVTPSEGCMNIVLSENLLG